MKYPVSFHVWHFSSISLWQEILFALFEQESTLFGQSATFSPLLTFVSPQHCANRTALFALGATDSYQVQLFYLGYMFILAEHDEEWDDMVEQDLGVLSDHCFLLGMV